MKLTLLTVVLLFTLSTHSLFAAPRRPPQQDPCERNLGHSRRIPSANEVYYGAMAAFQNGQQNAQYSRASLFQYATTRGIGGFIAAFNRGMPQQALRGYFDNAGAALLEYARDGDVFMQGLQEMGKMAESIGLVYRGKVPRPVLEGFAHAIASAFQSWGISSVSADYAFRYLQQDMGKVDGREAREWRAFYYGEFAKSFSGFLKGELQHNLTVTRNAVEHMARHRLAGMRAALQGRFQDAQTTLYVGNLTDMFSGEVGGEH